MSNYYLADCGHHCYIGTQCASCARTVYLSNGMVTVGAEYLSKLQQENQRLREALEMIASGESYCGGAVQCKAVAKIALEGTDV